MNSIITSVGEMGEARRITFFDLQIVLYGRGGTPNEGILDNYLAEYIRVEELYARITGSGLLHVMHTHSREEGEEKKMGQLSYSGKFLVEWVEGEEGEEEGEEEWRDAIPTRP